MRSTARLSLASAAVLVLLFFTGVGLRAQTSAASAPVSDRAARDAYNPLRVILEAGRLKMRVKPGPEVPAAPPRKDTTVRPKPASAPAREVAKTAPATVPTSMPPAPAASEPAHGGAAPAASPVPALVPAPAPAPETRTVLVPPSVVPADAPVPARPLAPLKNLHVVEPELPASALRRLRGEVEVVVGFTVNPDGSVSDVAIRSSPNPALDGPVVEAVRQWRYAPVEQPRPHAVQLVLRSDR